MINSQINNNKNSNIKSNNIQINNNNENNIKKEKKTITNKLFKLLVSNSFIYLEKVKDKKFIIIDRQFLKMKISKDYTILVKDNIIDYYEIDCFLGIIKLCNEYFIITVKESIEIGKIENNIINQILNIDLIQISLNNINDEKEYEIVSDNLKNLFLTGTFYYSIGFDLSMTFQELHFLNIKKKELNILNTGIPYYMWNYNYLNYFLQYNIDNDFIAPCICGFITMKKLIFNKPITIFIIERINTQLIDNKENKLDNYINQMKHIECIILYNEDEVFSFLIYQTFFPISSPENEEISILINFSKLIQSYQNILGILNSKNDELNNSIITKLKIENSRLQGKMQTISLSSNSDIINIESNNSFLNFINYYSFYYDNNRNLIIEGQTNSFWIMNFNNSTSSSFDDISLNLIMRLNWFFLRNFFFKVGLNDIGSYLNNDNSIILKDYKDLWIEYKNFKESRKIKLSKSKELGAQLRLQSIINYEKIVGNEKINILKKTNKLNLLLITWNVAAISIKRNYDLSDLFIKNILYEKNISPDIIVIGLQEIVELEVGNVLLNSNEKSINFWKEIYQQTLLKVFPNEKYNLIKDLNLVGIYMLIFSKNYLNTQSENQIIIKNGMMGSLGNKGNVISLIKCYDSFICFCCGHFTAGVSKNNERLKILEQVLNCQFNKDNKNIKFKDFEIWFIFGDLNFRINSDYNNVINKIKERNVHELINNDQFILSKNSEVFLCVDEGNIIFNPTYKFEKESDNYYFNKNKIRTPSWCDRIFYKKNLNNNEPSIILKQYDSINSINYSDHKPVFGIFEFYCKEYFTNEKEKVLYEMTHIENNQ